ncbi:hypothetical protein HF086_011447 [Spodoptera exigua]|uniref:RNase H type-1 domain-containing protein n=1 Tax=Spodoptera exigua TaxID=7107 RepID=A0A922SLE0_SPOEX|nr:hypothetical protein HF086_011447 [Spodoptera exigua]
MVKFPPETSVFTGECYGIFKCLEYILLLKLKKSVIFSDSKSALQALAKYPFKSNNCYPIILDCRKLLNRCISMGLQVALVWIPGHANIAGNVKADHVANEAVCSGDIFPYKNYAHDLAALPKTYLYDSWTQDWNSSIQVKGKLYKQIQPSIPVKPWFFKMNFNKVVTSCLIRMRLGHVCTPAHLAKFGIINSDICDCGADAWQMRKPCEPKHKKKKKSNLTPQVTVQ